MEKPSSSKSSKRNDNQNVIKTRSKTVKKYKRISYCESSSSDELVVDDGSQKENNCSYSSSTCSDGKFKDEVQDNYSDRWGDIESGAIADDKIPKETASFMPTSPSLSDSNSSTNSDDGTIADAKLSNQASNFSSYSTDSSDLSISGSSNLVGTGTIADDKRLKNASCSSPNFLNSSGLSGSTSSSPFSLWGQHSKGDELHKKAGTKDVCDESARKEAFNESWKKCRAMYNQNQKIKEMKELKSSKVGDPEKKEPNVSSNENIADLKFSPVTDTKKRAVKRPFGHSAVHEKHGRLGTEQVEDISERYKPIGLARKISDKDSKMSSAAMISQVKNTEEVKRRKIDDREEAGKKHPDHESNENAADMKFSPVTAVGKGTSKRRSYPNDILKENRPRTSM